MEPAVLDHPKQKQSKTSRLIRKSELLGMIGLGNTSLYGMIGRGEFPAPVRLSAHSVAWREDEVQAWIDSRPRSLGTEAGK